MSDNSSPTRRRRSESFGDEQLSAKKRMRTFRSALQGPTESTPLPGRQKLKNPRLAELQEEHDVLNETLAISFTGNENLDSPFFDRAKSTSYYHSCFEVIESLGSGCFAAVHKCRQKEDGKLYAIKEIKKQFTTLERRDALAREVRMLECLPPHPNIVGFKRAWQEGQKLFIQTELCQGDLAKFLRNLVQNSSINDEIPYLQPHLIPEELCWSVMIDIMQAARHLHRHGVVHLDIKPENVFTGIEDGRFKLGDFGIAFNFIDGNQSKAMEGDGRYAAPETFNLTSYTPKADSYSIGATVLQIAMGILNPRHARYQDIWADLKFHPECWETDFREEMSGKSEELWDILRWLLASKPQERPSPEELLEIPDMRLRVLEREKQLARNRFKYRVNSVFSSVLQLLAILCPRHLISKLRPLMRRDPHTPVHKPSVLLPPSTPTVPFMSHEYRSRESLRSSSTPSRVHTPLIGGDEESLSGRVNLTERFTDMDESDDAGGQWRDGC